MMAAVAAAAEAGEQTSLQLLAPTVSMRKFSAINFGGERADEQRLQQTSFWS